MHSTWPRCSAIGDRACRPVGEFREKENETGRLAADAVNDLLAQPRAWREVLAAFEAVRSGRPGSAARIAKIMTRLNEALRSSLGLRIGSPLRTSDLNISRALTLNPSPYSPVCYTRPHGLCIHGGAAALCSADLVVRRRYAETLILSQSGKRTRGRQPLMGLMVRRENLGALPRR